MRSLLSNLCLLLIVLAAFTAQVESQPSRVAKRQLSNLGQQIREGFQNLVNRIRPQRSTTTTSPPVTPASPASNTTRVLPTMGNSTATVNNTSASISIAPSMSPIPSPASNIPLPSASSRSPASGWYTYGSEVPASKGSSVVKSGIAMFVLVLGVVVLF